MKDHILKYSVTHTCGHTWIIYGHFGGEREFVFKIKIASENLCNKCRNRLAGIKILFGVLTNKWRRIGEREYIVRCTCGHDQKII